MAATAEQIAQLRRMVNEPTDAAPYTDAVLTGYIERYPTMDVRGEEPYTWQTTGGLAPTTVVNTAWIATYDLNRTAADIWEEKAAALAQDYDFNADGGSFQRSQAYEQTMRQARYYRSRRRIGAWPVIAWPPSGASGEIA